MNSFSLKTRTSRSPTNIVKTTTITLDPKPASKLNKAPKKKKWQPKGSLLEEVVIDERR